MERFYIDKQITGNSFLIEDLEVIHKLINVLRLKRGDKIIVFDNSAKEFLGEVTDVTKKSVGVGITKELENTSESNVKLNLYPSLFKKARFEWMLEKCTELGVNSFSPVVGKRSVVETKEIPERWNKIILEAAQQSGRVHIPKINNPISFEQALKNATGKILVALESNATSGTEFAENKNTVDENEISLFIGPEGGWDKDEVELFKKHRAEFLNLGKRILRAETAAIVCSALCIYK